MEDWYLWAEVLTRTGGFAMKQENALQSAAGTIKTIIVVGVWLRNPYPNPFSNYRRVCMLRMNEIPNVIADAVISQH